MRTASVAAAAAARAADAAAGEAAAASVAEAAAGAGAAAEVAAGAEKCQTLQPNGIQKRRLRRQGRGTEQLLKT